jgi:hypothetical protein
LFNKKFSIGIVTSIEYDPNRTANIASVYDNTTRSYFYILASINLINEILMESSLTQIWTSLLIFFTKVSGSNPQLLTKQNVKFL